MGKNKKKSKNHRSGPASIPQQDQGDHGGTEDVRGATAATKLPTPIMECSICSEKYDRTLHKPRNLHCGHGFCTVCCKKLVNQQSIMCPSCRQRTPVSDVENLGVNYFVFDVIESLSGDDAVATPKKKLASRESKEISPHGGRCLEARAEIAMHCAHCDLWLCKDCTYIDHKRPECLLTPYQDTLREMRQSSWAKVKSTEKSLEEFSREAKVYDSKLRSCTALMEMALDCVKRKKNLLAGIRDQSQNMEREIRDIRLQKSSLDLEEDLDFINGMETVTSVMQKWTTDASTLFNGDQVSRLSKILLQTAVQMHMNLGTQTSGKMMVLHNIKGVDVTLPLEKDGGRLLVHAGAVQNGSHQAGCRVVKLEHIKSCIDPSRALTFLDISLRGQVLGRMFIRLLGCTKRSQCFQMMCTGETGPSFLDTRFHRLWWVNLEGEHVWAGDYDHGDGSGGTLSAEILQKTKELPEKKTQVAITQGLVAGRYGECNSSIFRVYTKSSDTLEEAAFGRVEYGLNFLKDALECKNITDVTISGCGVVVEPCVTVA